MKIAVIGATGFLGEPVTTESIKAGNTITVLARDETEARKKLGTGGLAPNRVSEFARATVSGHGRLRLVGVSP